MFENITSSILSACSWVNGFLTAPPANWYPLVMALIFFAFLIIMKVVDDGFSFRKWLPWLGSIALFALCAVVVSVLTFLQVEWYRSYTQIQPFWSLTSFVLSFGLIISLAVAFFEDNHYGSDFWKSSAGFILATPIVHTVIMSLLYFTGFSTLVNHFYADSYAQVMALSFGGKALFLLLPCIVLLVGLGVLISCITERSWSDLGFGLLFFAVFCPIFCFLVCSVESLAVFYGWGRVGLDICGNLVGIIFFCIIYALSGLFGFGFILIGGHAGVLPPVAGR
jgi:hypothetical protein